MERLAGILSPLWDLVQVIAPFVGAGFAGIVWVLAFIELSKRLRQPADTSPRAGTILRYLLAPVTVTIFLLSIPLAPVLAVGGLILALVLLIFLYPLSLLIRSLPEFLKAAFERAKILSKRIFDLDEELLSGFVSRLRDIGRAILGNLGRLLVRFPPLINAGMRRLHNSPSVRQDLLSDIRGIENRLHIGLAADLLLAIALDKNHKLETRHEAINLLSDLNRPVDDLLHIIQAPGIDGTIAMYAADQAAATQKIETIEGRSQALMIWQALAQHLDVKARLHAAGKLSELGEVDQARSHLKLIINNFNIQANLRAQAACMLSETSLDSETEGVEARAQILAEAEQSLRSMANRRSSRERLEGLAGMVRLGHAEYLQQIVNMLEDANLEPELHQRIFELLVELKQEDYLRYAVSKQAPNPELQQTQRWQAVQALQKLLPAEAVKHWASYAAQPGLPQEKAKQALANVLEAYKNTPEGAESAHVKEGFSTLLELGNDQAASASLRLAAADTLEAMGQVKEANIIYYALQIDPTVDRRVRQKASRAVSRLSQVLLASRSGNQINEE
ncbi:MAG: hypothetical protein MUC85_00440 [Anaerolineales bacterium]|nr:hypothetical protein [Anaerolineales bacterium]